MSTREETLRNIRALDPPCEREPLALAAIELVTTESVEGVGALAYRMRTAEFLSRLDAVDEPQRKTYYLVRVFAAMELHPSPATRDLCLAAATSPEFTADPIRLNYLLPALAAVKPMTPEAAEVFRRTNEEGYYAVNGPLLTGNGTRHALRLFEEMMADRSVDVERRVDVLRHSVLPYRTGNAILAACARLLDGRLEPAVEVRVIETLFDYQPRRWFGPVRVPPEPRPWSTATTEALELALRIANTALGRADLPGETADAVVRVEGEISRILESRRA